MHPQANLSQTLSMLTTLKEITMVSLHSPGQPALLKLLKPMLKSWLKLEQLLIVLEESMLVKILLGEVARVLPPLT
jgi:hypothetical protein